MFTEKNPSRLYFIKIKSVISIKFLHGFIFLDGKLRQILTDIDSLLRIIQKLLKPDIIT